MSTDTRNPFTATAETTCPQTHTPAGNYHYLSSLVLVVALALALALAWRCLARPGPRWLLALDTVASEAPYVAPSQSSAISGDRGVSTSKHRTSRVEQGAASSAQDSPQLRRTRLGLAVTQGVEPEPRGHGDEAQEVANYQRVSTPSATPSIRGGSGHGLSPGVAQLADNAHGTTLSAHLSNGAVLAEASTSDTSEVPGANSHVAESVLSTGSIGTQPPWYVSLSPQEVSLRELVLSPHPPPRTCDRARARTRARRQHHHFGPIERVLAAAEERSGCTSNGHPPSPSTRSRLSRIGARSSSLVKALDGWDLSKRVAPLAIVPVGVSSEDLPGPDHDLKWISRTFPAAILYALRGSYATKRGILSALTHAFENAESVLAIVLYFTGHSDGNNAFKLDDGQSIDEATLFIWINELRRATDKHLPVFLVFDFCREDSSVPPVSTHGLQDVYIIWACRPGERSFEVNLGDDLPHSDLLKVVCLALHKMRRSPPEPPRSFMGEIADWVSCILKIHRSIICGKRQCDIPWNECRCLECLGGQLCLHLKHLSDQDHPPIQNPVAWFSGFGDDVDVDGVLRALQPILQYIEEPIQNVATAIVNNRWYLKFVPQDPSRRFSGSDENSFRPISASVPRGSSGALAAASAASLPGDSLG